MTFQNTRRRFLSVSLAALMFGGLAGCAEYEESPTLKAEHLVDSAVATVERFQTLQGLQRFAKFLPDSVAIAIFPSVIKAGFFVGGEAGNGLLMVRTGSGWSAPAFYTMGAGSFGLQFGAQDTEI
ncbi:MAG: lipid-binding SYLF domain-containing protein, partial [Rhodospirillales bacterium]|nr:lipid-binding SYLF domain-containing protein [Rhodospirillales bacterium]